MIDSTTFTKEMLSNPTKLTTAIINAMEATDTGGGLSINDPNNGFVMQMLANNHIFSKFSEKVDYTSAFYYARRARNAQQLYTHLSEYDFVKLMASPVTVPFAFAMSKNWIIANAVPFDSNYNKIQIPATSSITMGGVVYSMYYPIDILVNRNTGAVTAFYNFDTTDRLYTPESNMPLDVNEYTQNGIEYFAIQFNMFQFERKILSYTVSAEQGFVRSIAHDDQFYAVKVFNLAEDGSWKELQYSLSQFYYDNQEPTALISLLSDTSQVKIEIPQVYFTTKKLTQTIKIEVYTTRGAVSYSLSAADINGIKANFDTKSSAFAAPLEQMPTWLITPTVIEIAGGSDVMGYDEVRDAVVNQRLYDGVPITQAQLREAARKAGFDKLTRFIDDLTERMYYASNVLTDSDGMIVPTFTGNILIADESLNGNPDSIINFSDGYYTILPSTTFKIANDSRTCVPMSNGEVSTFQFMTKQEQVQSLNSGIYVRQPFHITLLTTPKSPAAAIYNLLSPKATSLVFKYENPNSAPQMSVIAVNVIHQNNGTGGYRILLTARRSSNIENANIANFRFLVMCQTKIGDVVYLPATFAGVDNNGFDVWEVILATNYHLTTDDHLTAMMYNSSDVLNSVEIPIDQTFDIVSMFVTSFEPSVPLDNRLNTMLPPSFNALYTAMSHQTVQVELGKNLSSQIYCGVNTSWGNDVYDLADETVYFTTNVPIFQTNEIGVIETRKNALTDAIEVVSIYNIGDTPAATGEFDRKLTARCLVSASPADFFVDDATGILVGMPVRGTNVPIDAVVTWVEDNVVTIDKLLTVSVEKDTVLTFTNHSPKKRVAVAQTTAGVQLELPDVTDIYVGHSVFGFGIPTDAKVLTIDDATHITLDLPTTEAVQDGTLLTFINTGNYGAVKIAKGEILKDPTGAPIVVKASQNQYSIPAILFDGRLFVSDDPIDQKVVSTISEKLQNYANQVKTMDESFLESSDVFYKPARTMGLATFGIGNNQKVLLPLSLSFSFSIYVDVAVYNSEVALNTIRLAIYSIINEEIQSPSISVSALANTLKEKLGSNVYAVEAGGINGDESLRLIALEDTTGQPGIEYTLVLNADNTIDRQPNIQITFLPRPDEL